MNVAEVMALAVKGVQIIQVLIETGKDAMPAIEALKNVFSKQPSEVTNEELLQTEAVLDSLLAEFNEPLPRAEGE